MNAPPELQTDAVIDGKLQRRDCAIIGAKSFALIVMILLVFWTVTLVAMSSWHQVSRFEVLKNFSIAAYLVVPPISLVGALIGFELYRIATGSIDWQPSPWWVWILGIIFLSWLVVPLYFQQLHRKRILVEADGSRTKLPLIYMTIYVLVGMLQATGQLNSSIPAYGFIQAYAVLFAVLLADCLLVNRMAQWRDNGKLAPPQTHRFQFTLGTMMAIMLGAGAWITGIVMIFSRR